MNITKQEFIKNIKIQAKKNEHQRWIEANKQERAPKPIKLPKVKDFDPEEIIIIKDENNETKNQ